MVDFIKEYRYYIFVPLGLLMAVLALLFVLGAGSEDDVAFIYQLF
jgi:hypothetical protein